MTKRKSGPRFGPGSSAYRRPTDDIDLTSVFADDIIKERRVSATLRDRVRVLREALVTARRGMHNDWTNAPRIGLEKECALVDSALEKTK